MAFLSKVQRVCSLIMIELIGNIKNFLEGKDDILFVVYTERVRVNNQGKQMDVIRIISARYATNFERGLYYGKY